MLIHVTISSKLFSFVVSLNLAIKDGLDVIFVWTLIEKIVTVTMKNWFLGKQARIFSMC